jgi:pyruvate/2-oxoglutarate/acetoin dehydrogenase E1 component
MFMPTDRAAVARPRTADPAAGRLLSFSDAICEALHQEMEHDPSVFVFGLDVDDHKAIQGSTRGLVERFGPDRVFATPLSEDAMTGVAIGAAIAGMRPVHVHIRMDFLMLCMNQLVNMAAKARYMWGGQVKVPMVVRAMIGKSWGQGPQHSQALYPLFMHIPGLKVVAPSNAHDAKGCLIAAIRDDNPVIFVEHRMLYFTDAYVDEAPFEVPLGRARVCGEGDDVTIVGVSHMVLECMRARELLAEVGVSAEVIDPVTLAPLDVDTIARSVHKTGRLIVVDNGWTMCGAGAEIAAALLEHPDAPTGFALHRMGFAPTTCPTSPTLEEHFYPNPVSIAAASHRLVRPHAPPWQPLAEKAVLAHQLKFRGPF